MAYFNLLPGWADEVENSLPSVENILAPPLSDQGPLHVQLIEAINVL